jgi:hypothetical protein
MFDESFPVGDLESGWEMFDECFPVGDLKLMFLWSRWNEIVYSPLNFPAELITPYLG